MRQITQDMDADALIAQAAKLLKYEDDIETLPVIVAQLVAAVVALCKANGYSEQRLNNVVRYAWQLIEKH